MEQEFQEMKKFSKDVQTLIQSPHFHVLKDQLKEDYRASINDLIAAESPEARARVRYIASLMDWMKMSAEKEEVLNILQSRNEEDY